MSDRKRELLENRSVSFDESGKKIISVELNGKKYDLKKRDDGHGWDMTTYDEEGKWADSVRVEGEDDIDFLEEISQQDVPKKLRDALQSGYAVSKDEYSGEKIITTVVDGKEYAFQRTDDGYDWKMTTSVANGDFISSVKLKGTG